MSSEILRFEAVLPARFAAGPIRERQKFEAAAFLVHDFPNDPYQQGFCSVFAVMCTQIECPRFCLRVRADPSEKHRNGFGVWYLEHRAPGQGWDEVARGNGSVEMARAMRLGISIVCAVPELRQDFSPPLPHLPEG